ncbi:MAG: hypothetical protein IK108_11995 [Clostridia bacterium]|nr:hypothetical protein [Clostridia bacterium]
MKKSHGILLGLVLIALGVYWVLRVIEIIPADFTLFFDGWWTLFIIVPCVIALFSKGDKALPAIGLAVGAAMLLAEQEVITWTQLKNMILPVLVVVLGLFLLLRALITGKHGSATDPALSDNRVSAVFGNRLADLSGSDFNGGTVTAVFGTAVLDLSRAMLKPDAEIRVRAVFGSVEVRLAGNTAVRFHIVPLFGGVSDRRADKPDNNAPALHVSGTVTFGSVSVV